MTRMQRLANSIAAGSKDFAGHDWIADLIYVEGPFLSLFRGKRGSDVLVLWVDSDARRNRWSAFPVTRGELIDYLDQAMSLREIVESRESYLFFHTSGSEKKSSFQMLGRGQFPAEYLPDPQSAWDPQFGTVDAASLVQERVTDYRLDIDGDDWYLEDLSKVSGIYRQLYAFHYAIFQRARTAVRATVAKTLSGQAWRGGFSTVNWFNALANVTPSSHRVRVSKIQYQSPGYIELEAVRSVCANVAASVHRLDSEAVITEAIELYKSTYQFFDRHKLTKLDLTNPADLAKIQAQDVSDGISARLDRFLMLYGMSGIKQDLLSAGAEELSLLKAMLSYHRRAAKLSEYIAEGSLKLQ